MRRIGHVCSNSTQSVRELKFLTSFLLMIYLYSVMVMWIQFWMTKILLLVFYFISGLKLNAWNNELFFSWLRDDDLQSLP